MTQYKKYKIYKNVVHEKIRCICLQSNKMCDKKCQKDSVYYDAFQHLKECFRNKKEE